jgi:hypothetical protein
MSLSLAGIHNGLPAPGGLLSEQSGLDGRHLRVWSRPVGYHHWQLSDGWVQLPFRECLILYTYTGRGLKHAFFGPRIAEKWLETRSSSLVFSKLRERENQDGLYHFLTTHLSRFDFLVRDLKSDLYHPSSLNLASHDTVSRKIDLYFLTRRVSIEGVFIRSVPRFSTRIERLHFTTRWHGVQLLLATKYCITPPL